MNYATGMRLYVLLSLICLAELVRAQCSCTDCTLDLPGGQTTESITDISGSTNDILGSSGQAIQAICINFLHDAINEANFTLIAPDGSSVQLVQSTGSSFDDNVYFDICFVACSQTAEPDPGFSEVFDSGENWMFAGIYSGSYYPAVGCLEDLTGSINGEWILEVDDVEAGDGGTLLDWCIQFADDAGLGCGTSCFQADCGANGGEIPDVSGTYCQGDPALDFDLTPSYTGNPPDPALYNYNYVQVDPDLNIVEGFTVNTDFSDYLPGTYQMCGFSYLAADEPLLPFPPPANYTYDDLLDDIANEVFCADVSTNCITVTIEESPTIPAFSGPLEVCAGELVTYDILNYDPDAFDYEITVIEGTFNQFVTNGGSVDIEWEAGPGEICVTASNDCGTQDSCLVIDVEPIEEIMINGPLVVCLFDTALYTLSPPLEPGGFYSVIVSGGVIVSIIGNELIVGWSNTNQDGVICVEIQNTDCPPEQLCIEVEKDDYIPPGFVDQPGSICIDLMDVSSIPDDPSITNIVWTVTGLDILSGQGTNEIEWIATELGIAEVCVEITVDCGSTYEVCNEIEVYTQPSPMITSIQGDPACGGQFNIFMVFSPSTDIFWTVIDGPPGGVEIPAPMAVNPLIIPNTTGTYTFVVEESIGDCVGYDTITIEITGGASATVNTECNLDGEYVVTIELEGGTPPYIVNGEEITGNIYVSDPIPSGVDYNFGIVDQNDCITQVTGMEVCPCLSEAGQMDQDLLEVCGTAGETVSVNVPQDALLDNDDAGVFVLHTGSGASLGAIIETNSTGEFGFQPGMVYGQIYYISYVVGNAQGGSVDLSDDCLSVAIGQPVIFYDEPGVSYNGPDVFCESGFVLTLDISSDVTETSWSLLSGPGNANITNALPASANVNVTASGVYEFEVTVTNGFCTAQTTFEVEVIGSIVISNIDEECNDPDEFVLTFEVTSGTAPFTADIGGSFSGAVFTSDVLLTANTYTITVTDANGCTSEFTVGPVVCNCISEAGTMSGELIELCEGDSLLTVEFLGGGALDDNDIERFVIHTGSGNFLVGPILETLEPNSIYLPLILLQTETIYYVSHVVGDEGVGGLDYSDPCLDASVGQPFIIHAQPQFTLAQTSEGCPGTIGVSINNSAPGGQVNLISNTSGGPVNLQLIGNTISVGSGIPTIVEVEYVESNSGCEKRDTVEVTFYDNPEVENVVETCFGTTYIISFEITGGVAPYTVNGDTIDGGTFISDTIESGTAVSYNIRDNRGCMTMVDFDVDCNCETEPGSLAGVLDGLCPEDTVSVDGLTLTGAVLDANDTLIYIVYSGTPANIDSILATGDGEFVFGDDFDIGVTYYVAALVTSSSNGIPDLNDPCLGVTNGIPFIWNPINSADIVGNLTGCSGDAITIPIISDGEYPIDIYLTSDLGDTRVITVQTPTDSAVFVFGNATETWSVDSISGDCAVIGSGQLLLQGEVAFEPEFNDSVAVCNNALFGSVLDLGALVENGVQGEWNSPDFTISNNTIDFDGVSSGIYTLNFETLSGPCPSEQYQVNIEVEDCDCPIIDLPFAVSLCISVDNYDLDVRFNISIGGEWSLSNPNGLSNPPAVENGVLDLVSSTPGTYLLTFTVTDSVPDECEDVYTLELNVIAPDPGEQVVYPTLCEGGDQQLDLNTLLEGADAGGVWTNGGSVIGNVISASQLSTGVNSFVYSVEELQCDSAVVVEVILGPPPEAGAQTDTLLTCEGDSMIIDLASYLDGADPGGSWTFNEQGIGGSIENASLAAGDNLFKYKVGLDPCSDSSEVLISVVPKPAFKLASLNVSCFGEDDGYIGVEVTDEGFGPYLTRINGLEREVVQNASPGVFVIDVTDANGCSTVGSVTITEPPVLEIVLSGPDTVMAGESATVTADVNSSFIEDSEWTFDGTVVDSGLLGLTYTLQTTDTVFIEVIDRNGCIAIDSLVIVVLPLEEDEDVEVFIPNVFNPGSGNRDNSTLNVYFNEEVESVDVFRVFDRWGALVFEIDQQVLVSPLIGWDGVYQGKTVNPGVFVYTLSYTTIDGDIRQEYGDVTLIR